MSAVCGWQGRWLLLGAALFCAGCGGSKGVKVQGQLVKDGQPYAVSQGENLALSLMGKGPEDQETICPAQVDANDGSFVIRASTGKDRIPPGKYKINLNRTTLSTDPAALAKVTKANKEFARINGQEVEVTNEPVQHITIDVGKGTISRS